MGITIIKRSDMKKFSIYIMMLFAVIITSCDELDDEQFTKYVIMTRSGAGEAEILFSESETGRANISISVSGSAVIGNDVQAEVKIDAEKLEEYNFEVYRNDRGLYYDILPENCYSLESMKATIKAGNEYGLLPIDINMANMNKMKNYILPLTLSGTSEFQLGDPKYCTVLLKIILKNGFSGLYAGNLKIKDYTEGTTLTINKQRNFYTVDNNTCYMYGGNIDETNINRDKYIIKMEMNADSTFTLSADNPDIELTAMGGAESNRIYSKEEVSGGKKIMKQFVSLNYDYKDLTNESYPVKRNMEGTFERTIK